MRVRMSRKAGRGKSLPVLLDSTYLLPIFGVGVKEIDTETLTMLRSLALGRHVELYYSPISLLEITAKIARETEKMGIGLSPEEVEYTIKILEEAEYIKPVKPDARIYSFAYRMRLLGHRDMIDNILYATATIKDLVFLTLDSRLRMFVQKQKLQGARIQTHQELMRYL
ncbi:MAG: PIN domain-containing protein [Desulfurococcales archaeon]|nr:PIN domain-containing protein [Desulfurococcales archaeon]